METRSQGEESLFPIQGFSLNAALCKSPDAFSLERPASPRKRSLQAVLTLLQASVPGRPVSVNVLYGFAWCQV